MRLRQVKTLGLAIGGAVILGLLVFFAPAKLGGSVTYSITDGISMQPLLHKNDLALVRAQASYHVGEVVLYQSQVLNRPVLHRIILIQNGNYFFKGDNNNFVDPGYATRSELVGKLWLHIPKAGAVLGWFGKPLHAAFIAGLTVMALVLTGFETTERKRRGHRRNRSAAHQGWFAKTLIRSKLAIHRDRITASATPGQEAPHRIPSYLEGPTPTLASLGILLFLALLFLAIGFSRPSHRLAPLPKAYQQTGSFSYSAPVNAPSIIYPSGFVKTGEPIYSSLVSTVNLSFKYRFTSALPHHIRGTIALNGLLLSQANSWQKLAVLKPSTAFTGDSASIASPAPLGLLYNQINSIAAQTGIPVASYSADVQPVVHIIGTVGGQPINQTFAPALPFSIEPTVATLNVPVAPAPPGATYVAPSASSALAATLHPVQSGSIPHLDDNKIFFAKYDIEIPLIRRLGFVFAMLALIIAVLHNFLRHRQTTQNDEELIVGQFQSLVVPVASLPLPAGDVLIEVADFTRLAGLAQYLERPIFYEVSNGNRIYAVDDDMHRYITRLPQTVANANKVSAVLVNDAISPAPVPLPPRHRSWRSTVVRGVVGLFVLVLAVTLVTSFTASTNVPVSYVGHSVNARQISELAPAGCSGLTLNSIVIAGGTTSNTLSHVLILGTSGVNNITDTGIDNCVVGGAGVDRVIAPLSDICIKGPTTGATYGNCTVKAS
jgi:signal peptidase I